VQKAIAGNMFSAGKAEIYVVDNNSGDGSIAYLEPKFPGIHFIANTDNRGFARANNQALALTKGKYILFLNPDTLVPEDCLEKCIRFMETHPDAGALGVRMVDGTGKFLKESKRAFPSPLTSLYKLFGLARLFPRSKIFARYNLGHLSEHENHEVDVLAGAFMMIRQEIKEKAGGFDETFFMYGEDVDLSYRIQEAGYKNYYFAESTIIHFKGESTRKGSLNYVRMFYHAMSIFVRKHYGGSRAGIFNFFIQLAIFFRAGVSALGRFIQWIGLPVLDAGFILLSFWIMKNIWSAYIKTNVVYEKQLLWIAFPIFTFIYLVAAYFAGLYDKFYKQSELNRSTIIATGVLLAVYALLPEHYRFSRGILLFGALMAYFFISWMRWLFSAWGVIEWHQEDAEAQQAVIVGTEDEFQAARQVLEASGRKERVIGRVAVTADDTTAIGFYTELVALHRKLPFREIIYCAGTLSYSAIVEQIQTLPANWKIKFFGSPTTSIVGSDSKDTIGESLAAEKTFQLAKPVNGRVKRLIDVAVSLLLLLSLPIHLFFVKHPLTLISNIISILFARKTWIGYAEEDKSLPPLRKGVLASNGVPHSVNRSLSSESLLMLDYWYARDYSPSQDWKTIWRGYRYLGAV
jgi:O-antigen biosynthesis protein